MSSPATCLQTLCQQNSTDLDSTTPLEQFVHTYLQGRSISASLVEEALTDTEASMPDLQKLSPLELLELWRKLLAILLILRDNDLLPVFRQRISCLAANLNTVVLWSEFQPLAAYHTLTAILLGLPAKEPVLCQLASGACPIEGGGHWTWGEIPQPLLHAELGILWTLYAVLGGDRRYQRAAELLAEWQQNTLDHNFLPCDGLFTPEGDSSTKAQLLANYVLFDGLAKVARRGDLAFLAEKQGSHLSSPKEGDSPLSLAMLVFAAWFEANFSAIASDPFYKLQKHFHDTHLALTGCREDEISAFATLYGGGTGMGCFHRRGVQVVNFGPQHLPLGDCRGFGLEGTGRLLASRLGDIKSGEEGFLLKGISRMTAKPKETHTPAAFRQGDPSGFWIEAAVEFHAGQMTLDMLFNGLFEPKTLAFAFFVKASHCLVDGHQTIKPRTFHHYQGKVCEVQFNNSGESVSIHADHKQGEMHVIPLGGGQNFWGADFLLAYHCQTEHPYRWQITAR